MNCGRVTDWRAAARPGAALVTVLATEGSAPRGPGARMVVTADAAVGTIGGGGFTELGVIGDPVNVAARIESATRELGSPLLLTEATRCLLENQDPALHLSPRGSVSLKGKAEPVLVHGLESRNAFRTPPA